ncbi:MAG: hypothetical protein N2318_01000 [Meiothermus sp.]|nr:hypothetical protein [Meiothermus sp.]
MERLDRIEAQMDDLREELRGLRLAHAIAHEELTHTLRDVRDGLLQLKRRPQPRLRIWAALIIGALGFGLGFTAHWRLAALEEVRHVQLVLPPRTPLQNLQQSAPGRD